MAPIHSSFVWPEVTSTATISTNNDRRVYTVSVDYYGRKLGATLSLLSLSSSHECGEDDDETITGIGLLSGSILQRPSRNFFEQADAVSSELQYIASLFCNSWGIASRIQHDKLASDSEAVQGGGFLHIGFLEIHPKFRDHDLGLRFLHEVLDLLQNRWTVAVMELNSEDAIRRHFIRMGFTQGGYSKGREKVYFLTRNAYFFPNNNNNDSNPIASWLTKEESKKVLLHESVTPHQQTNIDKELQRVILQAENERYDTAISCHDILSKINRILQRGADIHNARALHVAATLKKKYVLQHLVRLGGNVLSRDENGNTPLHVAASHMRDENIEYLLRRDDVDKNVTNCDGEMPLQCLQNALQDASDVASTAMGPNQKVVPRQKDVEVRLNCMTSLIPDSERALLIDGWMSPRMLFYLKTTAGQEKIDKFWRSEYFPTSVLEQIRKRKRSSFLDGRNAVWLAIYHLLQLELPPTVGRVTSIIFNRGVAGINNIKVQEYLDAGGLVEYVLDALVNVSSNVVKNNDDEDAWDYREFENKIIAIPATCLDEDFDLAWYKLISGGGGVLEERGPFDESRMYEY